MVQYSNELIPITGGSKSKDGAFGATESGGGQDFLPPLNTLINVTSLPKITNMHHTNVNSFMATMGQTIPSSFDLRNHQKTTEVRNQGQCGSCWAVSTATVINDHILALNPNKNPKISASYILTNYMIVPQSGQSSPANGCLGGSPAFLARMIANYGIGNECCSSYPPKLQKQHPNNNDNIPVNGTNQFPATAAKPSCSVAGNIELFYLDNTPSNNTTDLNKDLGYKGVMSAWGQWPGEE